MLTTSEKDVAVTASSQPPASGVPAAPVVDAVVVEAKGLVLPPDAQSPVASLPAGEHTVTIEAICDDGLIRCVYPDEFVKHHQATSMEDLLSKIVRNLRARYGIWDVQFTSVPKDITAGQVITIQTVEV
jgi:hypothetical protein